MSDLEKYYLEQAGSGIAFYPGVRYQRGHGVLGRLFGRILPAVLPILKSIGRTVLGTGLDVADDVVSGKSDFSTAIKTHGISAARNTAKGLISKGREKLAQSGSGSRRRSSRKMPLFTIKAGGALGSRKKRRRKRKRSSASSKATVATVKRRRKKSKGITKKGRKKRSSKRRRRTPKVGAKNTSDLPAYLRY